MMRGRIPMARPACNRCAALLAMARAAIVAARPFCGRDACFVGERSADRLTRVSATIRAAAPRIILVESTQPNGADARGFRLDVLARTESIQTASGAFQAARKLLWR